jgi:head-tail adaptor
MRAGPLRNRCQVTFPHQERNKSGGATETWLPATPSEMWAEIRTPSGRMTAVAEGLTAVVTAEIIARPRSDITAGWRITRRILMWARHETAHVCFVARSNSWPN